MAEITRVYRRLTRGYKANWSHLDQWDSSNLILLKVLRWVHLTPWQRDQRKGIDVHSDHYNYDASDAGMSYAHVIVKDPKLNLTNSEMLQLVSDEFNYGGCDCPGDCCGCTSGGVLWSESKRFGRREWLIVMTHGRNF